MTGELVRFGGYYTASSLMFYLATTADKIVLGRIGVNGERELGFYTQAFSLMMRPVYLVTTPLAGVMLALLSRSAHDPPEYRRLLLEFLRLVGWLLFPAGVGMFLVGGDLVLVLGGSAWRPAGVLLVTLAPTILVQGFFNVAGSVFASAGRARALFFGSAVIALVLCQAFVVGRLLGERFEPTAGGPALGVAWSYSLTSIGVLFVPYMLYCLHTVGVRVRDLLAALRADSWPRWQWAASWRWSIGRCGAMIRCRRWFACRSKSAWAWRPTRSWPYARLPAGAARHSGALNCGALNWLGPADARRNNVIDRTVGRRRDEPADRRLAWNNRLAKGR